MNQVVITLKLEKPYVVDAILIVGGEVSFISNYDLFIGMSSDWRENHRCKLPYNVKRSWADPTWKDSVDWANGVEAWCNMYGQYVSFVMRGEPGDLPPSLTVCEFGVIANLDSAFS